MVGVGAFDGSYLILRRSETSWVRERRLHFHERAITASVLLEGSLITTSEDRRINVVTSGQLETQELVDRTFIVSLTKVGKDVIVSGFPDGRLKVWKKEKNGQKVVIRAVRTLNTIKVNMHCAVPSNVNLVIVGGADKGIEAYNIESGNTVRTFTNGHSGAVNHITFMGRVFISTGYDMKIFIWNL
jgi:WD40 repeat protein